MIGLDMDLWHITRHAAGRALDMQITPDMMVDLLEWPDMVTGSRKYKGCSNYRRGDLAAGVDTRGPKFVVITFLWSSLEAWHRDFDNVGYADRDRRDYFGANPLESKHGVRVPAGVRRH